MSAYEERQALMEAAAELQRTLNDVTKQVYAIITRLVSEGDGLMLQAADEKDAGEHVTVRKIKHGVTTGRLDTTEENLGDEPAPPREVGPARKRNCGLCGKSTPYPHRAKNCPNAHLVQAVKKAAVEARPVKKKRERKPMSPERKAQVVAALTKARASRGKK